ncbi:MAG: hypothetical protein BSR46_17070 [Candidatus Dactylopiibacterium carminicum]|nr:MAG: hypothetical protein BSR46_17070 [Candidatus Dactylopiibacterium carminicum]
MALITLGALLFEQRPRLALAFGCAMLLAFAARHPAHRPTWAPIALLGRISYSVFLVHYPVCLLVNAAFAHWVAPEPWLQLGGMLLAWWLSLTAGWLFHHYVETWLTRHTTSATIARPHQAHFNT